MKNNKFYITTPIYYPNARPHLGTLYSTLLADVAARWQKIMGKETFFLTGTDEHGQKLQEAADKVDMQPKEYIDGIIPAFKKLWERYNIKYDKFIRTTDADHEKAVEYLIKKMQDNGDIYKSEYTGLYCVPCETYVNVTSETEKDKAGKYLCPTCNRSLREISEDSYFFRLSAYEDQLLDFYEHNPNFITPKERMNEVISFVKSGLKDLSISRTGVKWGVQFPGDKDHTVYVWADALPNYISGVGYGDNSAEGVAKFEKWWPADVQVMAKDIVRFHAVYWPAFLMSLELELPKKLLVHGYILMDEAKMSKSLGNAVDPEQLAQWYGIDQVRYYLVRQMAVNHDGKFDLQDLEAHVSSDLANNLGNLLNRTASLALSNGLENVQVPDTLEVVTAALHEKCQEAYRLFWEEMNKHQYHIALSELGKFTSQVNAFFHEQKPWVLAKQNKELFAEVIAAACNSLYSIAIMLWPVMPDKMEKLLESLGHKIELGKDYDHELRENNWHIKSFTLKKTEEPLFIRPVSAKASPGKPDGQSKGKQQGAKKMDKTPKDGLINITDFAKIQLLAVTLETCERVEGSDKMLKFTVNLGQKLGKRQVLSGVGKDLKPEDLIGRQGILVANLPPRKMMGLESQGMLLYAEGDDGLQLVTVGAKVPNGTQVK